MKVKFTAKDGVVYISKDGAAPEPFCILDASLLTRNWAAEDVASAMNAKYAN